MNTLLLDGQSLTLKSVLDYERDRPQLALTASAQGAMSASVKTVSDILRKGDVAYGINTGFGALANTSIPASQLVDLQYNLVRSHACGVGAPFPDNLARRIALLKANSLAIGCSGIRPAVVELMLNLLNRGVVPLIPHKGSVGASGDLAPLAHLGLILIGEGQALVNGKTLEGLNILKAVDLKPIRLEAKEGLAFLNGTQVSAALAIEGLHMAETLLLSAILIGALSVEGLAGSYTPFDERIHKVRNLEGQMAVAGQFRRLLTGSDIRNSHLECERVQDPYALRCMPQVFGAVHDTLAHAAHVLSRECNSVSDNPLIFGQDVLSGGNFHAEPLAFVSDFMSIAVSELGSISERRTDLLMRKVNPRLPYFLAGNPGVESGYMIAHVTAAALASENKTLAHPASVDSIPTSAGQEDHVSMAPWAGQKLNRIAYNVSQILAIELLATLQAIDAQAPLRTTPPLEAAHEFVRSMVPLATKDRRLDRDIDALASLIRAGHLLDFMPGWESLSVVRTF